VPRILLPVFVALALFSSVPPAFARPIDDGAAQAGLSKEMRDLIETTFANRFVYPETTQWHFASVKPYFGGSTLVCGHYNGQDSMRVFHGLKPFFVVVTDGVVSDSGFGGEPAHDVIGSLARKLKDICFPDM